MSRASESSRKQRSIGHYLLGPTLGQGTFGKVKLGTHILTGENVAIKILEKSKIKEVADVERVSREINILKRIRHKNVIQLYEVIDTPRQIFLIMEYSDGGELFDFIVKNQRVREPEACQFFQQIIDGVEYLHSVKVIHRDLKPENLLMQRIGNRWRIKVIDFGLSNTCDNNELLKTACGSPCYAAPEMIAGHRYRGELADLWSLGVVLFALVSGYLPFEDNNTSKLYKKILSGSYKTPKWLSPACKDLIRRILETDPSKRLSASDVRRHPWFTQVVIVPSPMKTVPTRAEDLEPEVLKRVEALGIDSDYVISSIARGAHNHATTTYYLIADRLSREYQRASTASGQHRGHGSRLQPRNLLDSSPASAQKRPVTALDPAQARKIVQQQGELRPESSSTDEDTDAVFDDSTTNQDELESVPETQQTSSAEASQKHRSAQPTSKLAAKNMTQMPNPQPRTQAFALDLSKAQQLQQMYVRQPASQRPATAQQVSFSARSADRHRTKTAAHNYRPETDRRHGPRAQSAHGNAERAGIPRPSKNFIPGHRAPRWGNSRGPADVITGAFVYSATGAVDVKKVQYSVLDKKSATVKQASSKSPRSRSTSRARNRKNSSTSNSSSQQTGRSGTRARSHSPRPGTSSHAREGVTLVAEGRGTPLLLQYQPASSRRPESVTKKPQTGHNPYAQTLSRPQYGRPVPARPASYKNGQASFYRRGRHVVSRKSARGKSPKAQAFSEFKAATTEIPPGNAILTVPLPESSGEDLLVPEASTPHEKEFVVDAKAASLPPSMPSNNGRASSRNGRHRFASRAFKAQSADADSNCQRPHPPLIQKELGTAVAVRTGGQQQSSFQTTKQQSEDVDQCLVSSTTSAPASSIFADLQKNLKSAQVEYKTSGTYRVRCSSGATSFDMEIRRLEGIANLHVIRSKLVKGDFAVYREVAGSLLTDLV